MSFKFFIKGNYWLIPAMISIVFKSIDYKNTGFSAAKVSSD
jgi:hypothetical protein